MPYGAAGTICAVWLSDQVDGDGRVYQAEYMTASKVCATCQLLFIQLQHILTVQHKAFRQVSPDGQP